MPDVICHIRCDLSYQNNPMEKKGEDSFAKMHPSLVEILTNHKAGYTNLLLIQEINGNLQSLRFWHCEWISRKKA